MSMLWCLSDPLHKKLETAYAFEMSRGLPYRPFSRAPSASVVSILICAANLDCRLRLYIVFISLVIISLDENKREPLNLIFRPDCICAATSRCMHNPHLSGEFCLHFNHGELGQKLLSDGLQFVCLQSISKRRMIAGALRRSHKTESISVFTYFAFWVLMRYVSSFTLAIL